MNAASNTVSEIKSLIFFWKDFLKETLDSFICSDCWILVKDFRIGFFFSCFSSCSGDENA